MVAKAFHGAADFRRGGQSDVGSGQGAGSGRRGPAGDNPVLVAYMEPAVGVFGDFQLSTGVAVKDGAKGLLEKSAP